MARAVSSLDAPVWKWVSLYSGQEAQFGSRLLTEVEGHLRRMGVEYQRSSDAMILVRWGEKENIQELLSAVWRRGNAP